MSINNLAKKTFSNPTYEEMRKQKIEEKMAEYEEALRIWEKDKERIEKINEENFEKWKKKKNDIENFNAKSIEQWKRRKN